MTVTRKILLIILAFLTVFFIVFGVTFASGVKNARANSVGNSQNYKGGKVKFPDYIFDENSVQTKSVETVQSETGNTLTPLVTNMRLSTYSKGPLAQPTNKNTVGVGEITGLFIRQSVDSNGAARWFFAYVGIPHTDINGNPVSESNPVSAVVCVHGGGGTAYSEWVSYWMNRGYAAIAMDTEGCVPVESGGTYGGLDTDGKNIANIYLGPQNSAFEDCKPAVSIEDQWFYSATSCVISSTTFLRSLPLINNDNIAITGISYGSYLTCLATAYDGRYCASVPVYGSLEQHHADTYFANNIRRNPLAAELWDTNEPLYDNKVPMLFVTGNTDPHFSVLSTSLSVDEIPNANMYLVHEYPHGHTPGIKSESSANGYAETEQVYEFIRRFTNGDRWPFANVEKKATATKGKISSEYAISQTDTGSYYYTVVKLPQTNELNVTSAKIYYTYNEKLVNNSTNAYCDMLMNKNSIDANGTGYSTSSNISRVDTELYGDYYYQYRTIWHEYPAGVERTTNSFGETVYVIKTDLSYIDNSTYFYFHIEDNAGHKMSSNVVSRIGNPNDMYYKLIKDGGQEGYFNYAKDANGWGTTINEPTRIYQRKIGSTGVNGYFVGPSGDVSDSAVAYPEVIRTNYGSKANYYSNGVTSLIMENNYVMNYNGYDVFEPIEFYYSVKGANESMLNGQTSGKSWFVFALFDDVQKGLLASRYNHDTEGTTIFGTIDGTLKTYDTSLASASLVAPKISFYGANTTQTIGGADFSGVYNKLNVNTTKFNQDGSVNKTSTGTVGEVGFTNDGLARVTILILEDKTEVYINGALSYTTEDVTRQSF